MNDAYHLIMKLLKIQGIKLYLYQKIIIKRLLHNQESNKSKFDLKKFLWYSINIKLK